MRKNVFDLIKERYEKYITTKNKKINPFKNSGNYIYTVIYKPYKGYDFEGYIREIFHNYTLKKYWKDKIRKEGYIIEEFDIDLENTEWNSIEEYLQALGYIL